MDDINLIKKLMSKISHTVLLIQEYKIKSSLQEKRMATWRVSFMLESLFVSVVVLVVYLFISVETQLPPTPPNYYTKSEFFFYFLSSPN